MSGESEEARQIAQADQTFRRMGIDAARLGDTIAETDRSQARISQRMAELNARRTSAELRDEKKQ